MCYVAFGAFEARVMADTRIWDNSAATLLIEEAGGRVTDWKGVERQYGAKTLVASNGACHMALLDILRSTTVSGV